MSGEAAASNSLRTFGGTAAANGTRAAALAEAGLTWELLDTHYKVHAQYGYLQPMSEDAKFLDFAGRVLAPGICAELLELTHHLEDVTDISSVAGLLVAPEADHGSGQPSAPCPSRPAASRDATATTR
ncbi:hypothetical protein [Actinophytocola oryzae]|uniref:Uncharacterized protein n=1 Tax=Actinophytocola oryzae TaxID=502181 RepID=A0A4R7VHK4_9PSEU|nr:hypothetical protein [Actinophytocola oryzae]TDV48834.1 hypothetical protein CLV71_108194 [Actinophytocola oryzae]